MDDLRFTIYITKEGYTTLKFGSDPWQVCKKTMEVCEKRKQTSYKISMKPFYDKRPIT